MHANTFRLGLTLVLCGGSIVWPTLTVDSRADDTTPVYSQLWGKNGEQWSPASRLPDFSYAGYGRGEKRLPTRKTDVSVSDFGAIGDGVADDTQAFKKAIAQSPGKTIAVPPGKYVIKDLLTITSSRTALLGAGPDRSVLVFPIPLNVIKPNWGATTSGRRTSNYSWSGGFVWVRGTPGNTLLSSVSSDAKRGALWLSVSAPDRVHEGQAIRIEMSDTRDQSLARYIYNNDPGRLDNLGTRAHVSMIARVRRVDIAGKRMELDRPLRTDVRSRWKPRVLSAASSVEEVSIEKLGFQFPNQPYKGHFTELGYNALALSGVRNCWIRDIVIRNADSGIFLSGSNITVTRVLLESLRQVEPSRQATGHHGVILGGQDNLLSEFEFKTRFMHDITVSRGSAGNVAMDGHGIDICFDHHCYGPHANLFTSIDLGKGSRMFQSGGGAALGRHAGSWTTFWNIKSVRPLSWPTGWGPDLMNLVGLPTKQPPDTSVEGRWFEPLESGRLSPANLYRAQLERRLRR